MGLRAHWEAGTFRCRIYSISRPGGNPGASKWMVSLVNSHPNTTSKKWHLWEIDLRFALNSSSEWLSCCLTHRRVFSTEECALSTLLSHSLVSLCSLTLLSHSREWLLCLTRLSRSFVSLGRVTLLFHAAGELPPVSIHLGLDGRQHPALGSAPAPLVISSRRVFWQNSFAGISDNI